MNYSLTNPQNSIWLTEKFYTGQSVNNICGYVYIQEKVNFNALSKAINEVVKTNDSMRLKFQEENNSCFQHLNNYEEFNVDIIELSSEKDIEKTALEMANIPFEIKDNFLFKFILFKLPNNSGGFIVNLHHIISDSWTLGLVAKEITGIYSEILNNSYEEKEFPSYLKYINSEKEYFRSEKYIKDKEYWNEIFKTVPEVATIPSTKETNHKNVSCKGAREKFVISEKQVNDIKEFCTKNKISVYNFFMAIYSLYVGRVSGLDDFVIGTPILNRTNFEQKHTMGMFISTVPLRINLEHEKSFSDFCKTIASNSMSLLRHQKYPYQSLLEDLRKKDTSIPNLYNVILSYQITKTVEENSSIKYSTDWIFNGNCADDLQIHLFDLNDESSITVAYDYKTDKYNNKDIADLHARILTIINQVMSNNDVLLKEIEIVTPEEKHQILYEFNKTKVDYPRDKTIVDLFEEQVEKTPDNIAVVFEDQKLTYKELNEKANQLANYLISKNVKNGDVVGILLDKSLEVIISILGILKVGATFLPIDISYPQERINYIVKDSNSKTIITTKDFINIFNSDTSALIVEINDYFSKCSNRNLGVDYSSNEVAYIMYTSGSTGNPKGVMVTHRNIIRLVKNNKFITFEKEEKILQTGSIVFDACTFEIWGALLNGFELFIIKKENLLDSTMLEKYLEKNKITTLWITAPLFNQLCETNPYIFKNVRKLLTGGDVLSPKHINLVRKCNPKLTVINGYGPTENTTFSCCFTIRKDYNESIPIGRPISNSTGYVVDNYGKLCPIGVPGELWVGGDGVAKGYLNNETLTKEKFIQNPFDKGIIYKTGDLVKWLPDGNIEFIGRIDNQVKIRGFRIELSEIDTNILTYPNIKQSISIVQNINNNKTICSYIVANNDINIHELKAYLSKTLANYMIPTYITILDKLPLNINGKIDRKLLPLPEITVNDENVVKPRNDIDKIIISCLKETLGISSVSITDSFFDIGVDSLSGINLAMNISKKLQVSVTVRDIFEYPTIQALSDYIATINQKEKHNVILKADKMQYYPLSSAQKRIYLASSIENNSTLYNITGGIIVDESLNIDKLQSCFKTLISRHEVLRTHFEVVNDEIVQIVDDNINFKLSLENSISDDLNEIYNNFVKTFDLSKAPLFRTKLVKLNDNKMLLLLDMHHIISDGTSLKILMQELCSLYNGEELSNKTIDYTDFCVWEHEQFKTEEFNNKKEFWINQFKDEIPLLNMPTTYSRPSVQSFEGTNYYANLSEETINKILETSNSLNITPYMLMLSCYYILLSKYTSQDDIVVGTPIVGRELPELSNMLGMFVNTLALRNKINSSLSFEEFSKNIKENCLNSFKNQSYPFDMLVKDLDIKRDPSRNPLFDTMFSFQNEGFPDINFRDIDSECYIPNSNISKFDISLDITPKDREYLLRFEYCTKLFDEEFIARFSSHYINILNAIIDNSQIKISDIDMLSEKERNQILYEFNNTKVDYPRDKTIVDLFEEQVEKTPDNIAVVFEDQKLTYKELNEKANQLANYLISKNVKNGDVIGILLDKSLEVIVSMFAILKTGAAFLPLDIEYPKERLNYILNNSTPKVILSSTKINNPVDYATIFVDLSNSDIYNKQTLNNLNYKISPEDVMYVMYTSGSTGKPKGVMVKHKNIVRLAMYPNFIDFSKDEIMVQTGTIVFDACIFEIFGSLLHGFNLYIIKKEKLLDINYFSTFLKEKQITILFLTTGLFNQLGLQKPEMFQNLKYLLTGGDVISNLSVKNIKNKCPNINLINCYGPTENGSYSTCYKVIGNELNIPIGKPITNSSTYVVDNYGKLCPIGVPGELWVGGDGVAKGYLNNETLTKEKFIQNPFAKGIIYKTGDLVKLLPDGNIEFIGRIDNQVKIRGFRIELSEIDTNILTYPNIKQSISIVQNINNNKTICSYIVVDKDVNIHKLKAYLSKTLANYMIPTYITVLDKLPLNINGKVDRKLLPIPSNTNYSKKIADARNNIDKTILHILKELFNLENVSIDDNLFDLGIDSLSSISLANNISKKLETQISVKDIFEYQTIQALSDYIATINKQQKHNVISKANKMKYYPLSSAQKRIYLASNIENDSTLYNIAGGIVVDKVLDINKLKKCFNILIDRHEALRTRFDIVENEVVQIIEDNIDFELTLDYDDTNDFNKIYTDFVKPFDLSKAPLFRTKLVKLNDNKMLLLLDMHHIISDGTSLGILLQELCDLYNDNELAEKELDYKDFTLWEKEQFESDEFKKTEEYWVNQFKDEIPLLNMPTTYPRPSIQSFEGQNYHINLSEELFNKVNEVAKKLNITPYMLMLSCYYILLSKYTSQDDIVVGTPIVGRELPELSNMLGMFVNTLALRNKIDSSLSFEEFSKNIKENCLNSFKNQSYPFDMLVKKLNIKKDTSRSALFDVMFIYQNNGYPEINFKDTKSKYLVPDNNVAKFDLSLEVIPIDNEYSLRFEYCSKLFDEKFIKRFCSHYINILNTILENDEIKIADIDMLSEEERNQILYEFNNTKVDYPRDKTIVDLFEEQVEKTPDNIAVVFENQKLTYRELNEKANQLARYLIEQGVSSNSIVGIMVPRSLEMIIAMFGILKSGAAYLPLDPTYPKNRIKYILKNSNVNLLLTKGSMISLDNINEININIATSNIYNKYSRKNLSYTFSSSNLAYVIYTSGSTGNPKGVTITHQNVNNFIKGVVSKIKFNDVIVSVTTICFDIFVLESILPLQKGLTIVIANESEQTVPQLLNELCIKNNVSMIQTTPSKFSLLISDENSLEFLKNIKTIMLGGETFPYKLLLKIRKLTKCKIYNMYGPTETTVWSSIKNLTKSDDITIGMPIANTSMYVLDNNLNILPIGVPGTLYIGGEGVSNGYLNREDLTNEKFIINPFNTSKKIYNTGDLAKWSANGELICLGRSDFQVKIRGLRIELEEIEKTILTFKDIQNAVVIVSTDSLNRQVLCAYFVSNVRISISELKQYLGMFLPNYMLPTYIMQIDDFKYTPNGKIDKKSLPEPDFTTERKRISMPKTETECKILEIWENLLCISPISISDNFFEIGGDSLLALKMQIELLKQNITVTYAEIFKYNTIKKLASLVDKKLNIIDSNIDIYANYDYSNINSVLYNNNISNIDDIKYKPLENVLLTGVTGFLGAHILDYLMKNTNVKVYCLVRKDPGITLLDKVLNKLHFYFGNVYDELINKRIFIINSNLTQDKFGLTDERIISLSSKVSCVINSAAIVKHYGDYDKFEEVNVTSVKRLIDFCEKYNKRLIQISTISVSGNTLTDLAVNTNNFTTDVEFTESNLYIGQSMENVYVRSKFEAEKLILEEINKNKLNALILRIGNITNRSTDGKFQYNSNENAFANKIKAYMELSSLPDYILDKYIEFSPVDAVAEAVVKSIEYSNKNISILHIYNQNHIYLNTFISLLPKKYNVNIVSDSEFKNIIENMLKNDEKKYIISHILNDLNDENKLIYETYIKIKNEFSQNFLNKTGFKWPNINKRYIENLLNNI